MTNKEKSWGISYEIVLFVETKDLISWGAHLFSRWNDTSGPAQMSDIVKQPNMEIKTRVGDGVNSNASD